MDVQFSFLGAPFKYSTQSSNTIFNNVSYPFKVPRTGSKMVLEGGSRRSKFRRLVTLIGWLF